MVQYHALGVLYHIKQKDRIAVSKLVISQMKSASLRSPYATCLLIRYVSKVMETESDNATMCVFWPAYGTYIGPHFHLVCALSQPVPPRSAVQHISPSSIVVPGMAGFLPLASPLCSPSRRFLPCPPLPLLPRLTR